MTEDSVPTGGNSSPHPTDIRETVVRRNFHACDSCRQRKIRCDGTKPSCEWCRHHSAQCTYKRKHRKKRQSIVANRSQGQSDDTSAMLERLQQNMASTMEEISRLQSRILLDACKEPQEHDPDSVSGLRHTTYERPVDTEAVFFKQGAESGIFSLYKGLPFFSAECQEWVKSRTGEEIRKDEYFQSQMGESEPCRLMSMHNSGYLWDLPSREDLDHCVDLFDDTRLSRVFPVIEVGAFPTLIDSLYDNTATMDTRACAYALIIFVTSFTADTPSTMDITSCNQKLHLLIPVILLQKPTIASLQTILIMALCQMMHGNIQAVDQYIAIASRIIFVFGGHHPSDSHVRTLFWVCYILDKDVSLRTGRLPVICDEHCDLTLPAAYSECTVYMHASEQPFWTDLRLSIIKSRAYNFLYSPQALTATDAELVKAIRKLGAELDEWWGGLPETHRPAFTEPSEAACKEIRWILIHLDFHHCVTMVHQASSRCIQWSENKTQIPGVHSSFDICVAASRSSLHHLLKASQIFIHDPNFWVVIFYPISASISLFCNILLRPFDQLATDDLLLISRAPATIFQLSTKRPSQKEMNQYHALVRFIAELSRLAKQSIQNAHNRAMQGKEGTAQL